MIVQCSISGKLDESACLDLVFSLNSFVRGNSWNLSEKIKPKMLTNIITFLPSASAKALKRQEKIKKIAFMVCRRTKNCYSWWCLVTIFIPSRTIKTFICSYTLQRIPGLIYFAIVTKCTTTKTSCLSFLLFIMICVNVSDRFWKLCYA